MKYGFGWMKIMVKFMNIMSKTKRVGILTPVVQEPMYPEIEMSARSADQ